MYRIPGGAVLLKDIMEMKKYTREEIEKKVNRIMVDKLGINGEYIRDEAVLEADFGLDSLDCIDLVMSCEREFSIRISDMDIDGMPRWKVSQVYDMIEGKCV